MPRSTVNQLIPHLMVWIKDDEQVELVTQNIIDVSYTGEFGDGKIFIYDVNDAIRVITKERGEDAIK